MTGRLAAWTIELSQFYIEYKPHTTRKAQTLSDFVVECQFSTHVVTNEGSNLEPSRPWNLYVDGSSTLKLSGVGIILISPEGFKIQHTIKFSFQATNNEAEYEAIIARIKLVVELETKVIDIYSDSQLVVKQVTCKFKTDNERMASYRKRTQDILGSFTSRKITNMDRIENQWEDALSKLDSSSLTSSKELVYMEELLTLAIHGLVINEIS